MHRFKQESKTLLSVTQKGLDLLELVDARADVRSGFLWTEGLNVSRDKKTKHRQSKGGRGCTEAFSAILLDDPSGSRV